MTPQPIEIIERYIKRSWSSGQISGRLLKDNNFQISHETIYQHILRNKKNGENLYKYLRCQKKRKCRYGSKANSRRGQLKDRISIEERPLIVNQKDRVGDWEEIQLLGTIIREQL